MLKRMDDKQQLRYTFRDTKFSSKGKHTAKYKKLHAVSLVHGPTFIPLQGLKDKRLKIIKIYIHEYTTCKMYFVISIASGAGAEF